LRDFSGKLKVSMLCIGINFFISGLNVQAESNSSSARAMLLGDALAADKIKSWEVVEQKIQAIAQAERLIRNFSLQDEFSPDGRLIGRKRIDGNHEQITYGPKDRYVWVWVTSPDGKFKEERLYIDNYLRAVLYGDGSLKTFQYLKPLFLDDSINPEDEMEPALCVIISSATEVKILQYNSQGKLINGFMPDGRSIMKHSSCYTHELKQIINIDELQFFSEH